jgi:hypothetical protein
MADSILEIQARADFSALFGEANAAADSVESASNRIKRAMDSAGEAPKKLEYSMMEARHAAAGFGEEIGVHIPRVLSTFLAHSETIGPILASAFSAVAIVMFVQVLAQVPELIDKIIGKFTGWDEVARKTYNDLINDNNRLLMKNTELADKQEALNLIGITGSQKYAREIENIADSQQRWGRVGEILQQKAEALNKELEAVKNAAPASVPGAQLFHNWLSGAAKDAKDLEDQLKAVTKAQEEVAARGATRGQELPVLSKEKSVESAREAETAAKEVARVQHEQILAELNDAERAVKEKIKLLEEEVKANREANKSFDQEATRAAEATKMAWEKAWEAVVRAQDKANKDAEEALRKEARQWDHLFGQVNRGLNEMVRGLINGTESVGRVFEKLGESLLMPILTAFEQAIEAQILYNVTSGALGKEHALAGIFQDAYKAAANVYAEVPFPFNLVAAPAMFATVMALGAGMPSGKGGWDIGNSVPASGGVGIFHPNEMLLPADIADNFRGAGSGGGMHLHVHAIDAAGVQRFFDKNGDKLIPALRRARREFKF